MADIKQAAQWMKKKILPHRTNDPIGHWIGDSRPIRISDRNGRLVYSKFIFSDGTTNLRLEDLLADDLELADV